MGIACLVEVAEALPQIDHGSERPGLFGEATHVVHDISNGALRSAPSRLVDGCRVPIDTGDAVAAFREQTGVPPPSAAQVEHVPILRQGQVPCEEGDLSLRLQRLNGSQEEFIPGGRICIGQQMPVLQAKRIAWPEDIISWPIEKSPALTTHAAAWVVRAGDSKGWLAGD